MILGAPQGNLEALRAALDEARRLGVPPDRTLCIGPDPGDIVRLLRDAGVLSIRGGHEESAGAGGRGDAPNWSTALPQRIDLEIGGYWLAVVARGPDRCTRPVFPSTAATVKLEGIRATGADGVIAGTCGLPFSQVIGGRLWHDPGALGRPADDGTARVWYSLLRPDRDGLMIEHRALDYDHRSAARRMRAAGLPQPEAEALATGRWPCRDALPAPELRAGGIPLEPGSVRWTHGPMEPWSRRRVARIGPQWPDPDRRGMARLDPTKFRDRDWTATGAPRARVPLTGLRTLWFNTGTRCNIECRSCYIESSPRNDRLHWLTRDDVGRYLDEIRAAGLPTEEIGFTGGEPFMNPDILPMLEDALLRGFRVLVLTNAMRPMQRLAGPLLDLNRRLGARLTLRVSLDHFTPARHEEERGPGSWTPTLAGLVWLARNGFNLAVAGRTMWGEDEAAQRAGYARLFAEHGIPIDARDPAALVLFPEMDETADIPEISTACWGILGKVPDSVMCASSRMVVRRKGAERATVVACTLLPYDPAFELGETLAEAAGPVALNHPHCARFCVLGGASCSR